MNPFSQLLESVTDLPVSAGLPRLRASLQECPTLVVSAPPGTGKTTLIPPLVSTLLPGQKVIVTQPRRIAARAAACRIASLLDEPVGGAVGYSVRGDTKVSPGTLVEFVTPGVLLRRLQLDPELSGIGAVIIDEVHERNLDSDLALAFLHDVRLLREDLLLVAMSATVAAQSIAPALGEDTPIVEIPGVVHPLEIIQASPQRQLAALGTISAEGQIGVRPEFLTHVADTTLTALAETSGDVLVFVPGVRELEKVRSQLEAARTGCQILPLHGGLSARQQDQIYDRTSSRKVIVSTAVAESSLTVPGVRVVVDACLSREPRVDLARDMSSLVTVRASRAACIQRAGRAGREGPGTVYRCVDANTWAGMREFSEPEILHSDLTALVLHCTAWGAPQGQGLTWLTAPPAPAVDAAVRTLGTLGAINENHVTALGQKLTSLPISARLGRALLEATTRVGATLAAQSVAVADTTARAEGADATRLWSELSRERSTPAGAQWKQQWQRLERQAQQQAQQLVKQPDTQQPDTQQTNQAPNTATAGRDEALATVFALAWPDRIARRRNKDSGNYLLANGVGAQLPKNSPLFGQEWLAVADLLLLQGRSDAQISLAAPIPQDLAIEIGASLRQEIPRVEVGQNNQIKVSLDRQLGSIRLQTVPDNNPPQTVVAQAIREYLQTQGLQALPCSPAAAELLAQLRFLHQHVGDPWPDVSWAALQARLDDWLGTELQTAANQRRLPQITVAAVQALLPWPEASRLAELAPTTVQVPAGQAVSVDYAAETPRIRVRLQQCFGWTDSPRLADGRVPLTIELLSPAQRPLAITADLHSFWTGPYAGVRAEMRGRYPKHPWPEDPLTATPTTRTKRRS